MKRTGRATCDTLSQNAVCVPENLFCSSVPVNSRKLGSPRQRWSVPLFCPHREIELAFTVPTSVLSFDISRSFNTNLVTKHSPRHEGNWIHLNPLESTQFISLPICADCSVQSKGKTRETQLFVEHFPGLWCI